VTPAASKVTTLEEAVKLVPDGARLGLGGSNALWRRPMAFVRELIRAERTGLHLFNMIGGPEIDLLLGAGVVASTNCCYVGLDEIGHAPNFQTAARAGTPEIVEYSEFSFMASLRAAAMGLPFIPWKTALGTDVVRNLGWKTVICPYTGMELLAVPANPLDVTVIHATRCDSSGNVELARPLDFIHDFDYTIARAAKRVIVCAERVEPIEDATRVALIGREVTCVVHTPRGAWPCGVASQYPVDTVHLTDEYLPAAATPEGFAAYLERFVYSGEGVVV
jgi:glutaconate CoA-transferase subunit A